MKYWKLCNEYGEIVRVICQDECPVDYIKSNKTEYTEFKNKESDIVILYPDIVD